MDATGIYVHIPFCHHRCTYCDFNIYAGMRSLYERYARAVAKEILAIRRRSRTAPDAGRRSPANTQLLRPSVGSGEQVGDLLPSTGALHAPTIYFGGGTPSLMPVEHIRLILDAIRSTFDVLPDAEVTLEANPRTDDAGYFARLRELGVNRISLGMQSAIERDLRLFRRGHTFDDVARTVHIARSTGFDNLNLDLIYGIPGQSLGDWRATLEAALSLGPEHISAYCLQVEDGTTLKKWIAQGKLPAPDDDLAADMFNLAEAMLEDAGFIHYEISNWARGISDLRLRIADFQDPHSEIRNPKWARHNLTYWLNEPYLGFGCGAHSWFGGRRFGKVRHPREYLARIEAEQGAEVEVEAISRELEMGETMMVGLRLLEEGVTFERFAARFGADLRDVYRRELERSLRMGLIEVDAEHVRLSRQGRLVGNRVFGEFLPTSSS